MSGVSPGFHFGSYLHTFEKPNNVKSSLTKKLNLIFKFSLIRRQINVWGIKREKMWRKTRQCI